MPQLRVFVTSLSIAVYEGCLPRDLMNQWRHLISVSQVLTAPYMRVRPRASWRPAAGGVRGLGRGSNSDEEYHTDGEDSGDDSPTSTARKNDNGKSIPRLPPDDIIKCAL